jgi:hypothetical protein
MPGQTTPYIGNSGRISQCEHFGVPVSHVHAKKVFYTEDNCSFLNFPETLQYVLWNFLLP